MLRVDQVMRDRSLLSNDELLALQDGYCENAVGADADDELLMPELELLGMRIKTIEELELESFLDTFDLPFDC